MNRVVIIGAGKFAFSFTSALKNAGFSIEYIISRNRASAEELAAAAGIRAYSDTIIDIPDNANIIFLTVPDSGIENAALQLSGLQLEFKGKVFAHCSGALDSTVLNSLANRGAATASYHIMQTFPSKQIIDISGCYASIETNDDESFGLLYNLSCKLNLRPFRLNKNQKTAYHLAGVFASNFLAGNIFSASEVFSQNINTFDLLEPIINSTLNNIKKSGAAQALSGPIDRGDIETIRKHINLIKDKDLLFSYISQSRILLHAAEIKYGGLSESHKKIKELLDNSLI